MLFYLKSIRLSHKNCLGIHDTKAALLPKEVAFINFQNFKRLKKHHSQYMVSLNEF